MPLLGIDIPDSACANPPCDRLLLLLRERPRGPPCGKRSSPIINTAVFPEILCTLTPQYTPQMMTVEVWDDSVDPFSRERKWKNKGVVGFLMAPRGTILT